MGTKWGTGLDRPASKGVHLSPAIMAYVTPAWNGLVSWGADCTHLHHLLTVVLILHLTPSELQSELDLVTLQPREALCQHLPGQQSICTAHDCGRHRQQHAEPASH